MPQGGRCNGHIYRSAGQALSRDHYTWLAGALGNNEMIADKLHDAGFTDVKVEGSGGTRQAEALWPIPNATAEMPSQITAVIEV
jgi:hypothetical protein